MPCAPDTLHHSTSSTSSSQQLRLELRLRRDGLAGSMAATAKHELRRNSPTGPASPTNGQPTSNGQSTTSQDDIAAIAKQISDHAEAIYQTWKSRGLAPTEILKCHTHVPGAADKFGSVLSPTRQQPQQPQQPTLGPADALASQDNNNLEKLVNKFVVEDKARRQRSPSKTLPSSIAFALQKFEQNGAASRQQQSPTTPTQLKGFGSRSPLKPAAPVHNDILLETIEPKPAVVQPPSTGNYLDEVAREEERLINALKTGCVVADEDKPAVAQPVVQPKQKPLIVRETKPKVEPVKPILISPGLIAQRGFRLEPPGRKEPSPKPEQPPKTAEPEPKPAANKDEKDFIASRWGLRLNSSRPRPQEPVPHPELTTQQKQHIRQATAAASSATASNPVRPFLTRGSVAERVLIFEKCPSELLLDKRGPRQPAAAAAAAASPFAGPAAAATPLNPSAKPQPYARDKVQPPKSLPPHTTLQRHVKANRNVLIPRFYFPGGKPTPLSQAEATVSRITAAFQALPAHRASRSQFHTITKACDLPLYWKIPLFLASGGDTNGIIEMNEFLDFWKELTSSHHDAASKFVRIVTKGARSCILPEDLIPLVQDVVETHPGLTFLKEATEFHSRYVHTVIARIFYCVNRSWSGKISVAELRRSNLLTVISVLEHKEDINQVTAYFSYEHFYVIYCKFWELDRDHDLFIDKMDLTRHNDHALSTRMIERIFSGAVTRGVKSASGVQHPEDKMSYTEFVWFLLSEEDKNHPTAIEYWFRCMDLDGDGYLSMYELEYFYEEQLHRMEAIGIETLPFEDCLCQMLDMIHPAIPGKISLSDMKKCKMTSIFFDTFFNLEKYLDHEQRDPFASARDHDADGHELSDWDRFAAEEYELLVAEESGNDQNDQSLYDSCAEDAYSPNLDVLIGESVDAACQAERASSSSYLDEPGTQQQRPKSSHYDSCDSDDYADSDN